MGRAVCYLLHQAPQLGRMEKWYRLHQHTVWQVHELFWSTCWGKKKKRWILAALNVLELGSAHTTALTNPLGTAGIPGLLLGGKAQHYVLHLSKQKYSRGTGGGDFWMAKAKHLSKASVYPVIFWALRKAQLKPGSSPCLCHCSWAGSTGGAMLGAEALNIPKFYRGNWLHAINKNGKYFLFSLRRGTLSNGFILICQALP